MNRTFALLAIFATASLPSAIAQEWQPYNGNDTVVEAIQNTTAIELCDVPYSSLDKQPTCGGKPWNHALAEATETLTMPDKDLRVVFKLRFDCYGKPGNLTCEDNSERMTAHETELFRQLAKAAMKLTCEPAKNNGKPIDYEAHRSIRWKESKMLIHD